MELFEVKTEIPAIETDAIDTLLLELGIEGWSLLEDAIAKRAWVVGIFASDAETRRRWAELESLFANAGVTLTAVPVFRALGDADWRDSYKAHFHAWQFGALHWVPVWERETFKLPPGHAVLWLDPGLAFGTGNHETTRLCVERLVAAATQFGVSGLEFGVANSPSETPANSKLRTPNSKPRVIDAGCGSGILALSAALLDFQDIVAFDNDPEAIRVSEENAVLNGLTGRVNFFVGDLVSGLTGREAELVLANIQADVLMRFARELLAAVAPRGTLVLSGILAIENEKVRAAFLAVEPGWSAEWRVMGEWSDVVLTRI